MKPVLPLCALMAAATFLHPSFASSASIAPDSGAQSFAFQRSVANVEFVAITLRRDWPSGSGTTTKQEPATWYGEIFGRHPAEPGHLVPFSVTYEKGIPFAARYDANQNGDLSDDLPVTLAGYPPTKDARSFLADLRASARAGDRTIPVDWKVRIVIEPAPESGEAPIFRAQWVYAMMGTVTLDGKPHRAVLFDGNYDGLYTTDAKAGDGLFVDLDDDLHFWTDLQSPEFASLSSPIQMGPGIYEVAALDPEGTSLALRQTGSGEWIDPPKVGGHAPDFTYTDISGRKLSLSGYHGRYVILYFWATWCPFCRGQAPGIRALYDRFHALGLEILAVSADTDRAAMEKFRADYNQVWPTSYSGIRGKGDPVVALYRPYGTGTAYLIDPSGVVEGIYEDVGKLSERLEKLIPQAAAAGH